jgi:predicted amidophosphoribosyltransferase
MDFSFKKTAFAVAALFYPPLCVHCNALLKERGPLFCSSCLELLSLVEAEGRCRVCFGELYKGRCERCIHRPVVVHRQMAACEAMGPARSLVQGIHNGRQECVPAAASLMAYQWLKQQQQLPDLLIPLSTSFLHRQKAGFDPHLLLARELGTMFGVPVLALLKSRFDRVHFFTQGEFRFFPCPAEKKGGALCDRRVLLVMPQLDDGLARSVGLQLHPFFPAQIEALAFVTAQ